MFTVRDLLPSKSQFHLMEYVSINVGCSNDAEHFWLRYLQAYESPFKVVASHPELEYVRDSLGLATSFEYVRNGNLLQLSREMELNPQCCLLRDRFGATLLHWAAVFANRDAIATLLAAGADVNAICRDGSSVLIWAMQSGFAPCVEDILRAGADIHHLDEDGYTALMNSLLHRPVRDDIVDLLLQFGSEVQILPPTYYSVLVMAVEYASTNVCRKILDHGASPDDVGAAETSAVHTAIQFNRRSTLQLLIDRGASLNSIGKSFFSTVHFAALYADIETMRILQEAHIEGLRMDSDTFNSYWTFFDARHDFFQGTRAPIEDERAAFQALLDSLVPSTLSPLPSVINEMSMPGAFPLESESDTASVENEESEPEVRCKTANEGRYTDLINSFGPTKSVHENWGREVNRARSNSI